MPSFTILELRGSRGWLTIYHGSSRQTILFNFFFKAWSLTWSQRYGGHMRLTISGYQGIAGFFSQGDFLADSS